MRVFSLTLPTELAVVNNPFSDIAIVTPIETGRHNAFVGMAMVNERIYIIYRNGRSHNSIDVYSDNNLMMQYSDDYGETWSTREVIFTGQEVLTDYPQYLVDDPLAKADTRDPEALVSPDGNWLVYSMFVTIGHQLSEDDNSDPDNIEKRVTTGIKTVSVKVPIISGVPDFTQQTYAYVNPLITDRKVLTGTFFYHGTKLYISGYGNPVYFYESLDNGDTWTKVGEYSPFGDDYYINEATTFMNGETMISVGRNGGTTNRAPIWQSVDYGRNWTKVNDNQERIDGLDSKILNNGRAVICGRKNSVTRGTFLYVLNTNDFTFGAMFEVATNGNELGQDRGYPTIIKHLDKYFVGWYDGTIMADPNPSNTNDTGIYFRQLNYDADTYTFSLGND